jgi:CMP/dCMP kinase
MNSPVITVDGPSGSGKGTISHRVAQRLSWHLLDSGALYRVLAYDAIQKGVSLEDGPLLAELAQKLPISFVGERLGEWVPVLLNGEDVSALIRTEECAGNASKVAALPMVRVALLDRQKAFRRAPGLIADGRDMGTIVFEDADLKIFLEASVSVRAERRWAQLKGAGHSVSLQSLFLEVAGRDERDRNRLVAPLKPATDAIVIDTSTLSIDEVFNRVYAEVQKKGLKGAIL